MDHKFKSLLQNVATRHVIRPIPDEALIRDQLQNLRKLDIVNFFILGSLTSIKRVLDAADSINFFNRKFAWHSITQDKGDLKCSCSNATILFAKPLLDAKYQDRLGLIRTSYQLTAEPEISATFYFDLALQGFLAVKLVASLSMYVFDVQSCFFIRNMINDGAWHTDMTYITCDDYDGKNSPDRGGFNLKKYFAKVSITHYYFKK